MTYLTENPVPGLILLGTLAVIAFFSGHVQGKLISIVCLAAAVGLYVLEQQLVSTGEQVEMAVEQLLQDFKEEDLNAITNQIDGQDPELVQYAKKGLELVDLDEGFAIRSVETTLSDDEATATTYIRANGKIRISKSIGAGDRHMPTFWKTVWVRPNQDWKLKSVTRLNPANGDEMELFGKQ